MSTQVELIKEKLNILDVVSSYVKLSKSGKHYKGKSPFTNEKTPSFFVSPERGMYYCFSSGKGGDIFTFVQEMEGIDFRGALKVLAERAGVDLVSERPEARTEREELYQILEKAARFYEEKLDSERNVRSYVEGRGVAVETVKKWRIGFAPDSWRALRERLNADGFKDALLEKAGLIKRSEKGTEPYDVFRNRVMFPICDSSGRVVAFSGRDQSGDPTAPKYVNSPETALYEKSRILFGYDKAKHGIRALDFSLIVEGQFDLVLAHQAGYGNTVAISGTALSPHHIEQLGRLSERIVLALDADRAGIASASRAAMLALARGMDVKIAKLPESKDPADLVREDPQLLKQTVGKAMHIIQFMTEVSKERAKNDRMFRLLVRDEVLPFIVLMPNRMDAEHFEEYVARETRATVDAVHHEVERIRSNKPADREEKAVESPLKPAKEMRRTNDIVEHLYGVLLWQQSLSESRIDSGRLEVDLRELLGERYGDLGDWPSEEKNRIVFEAEARYIDETIKNDLTASISELLYELAKRTARERLAKIRSELSAAERSGDETLHANLLAACGEIQKTLSELERENPYLPQSLEGAHI